MREFTHNKWWNDSWKNKARIRQTDEWPQDKVFDLGLEFLEFNKDEEDWFLQIETFDPHEPFDSPDRFSAVLNEKYDEFFDWPPYAPRTESDEDTEQIREHYKALLRMCDENLGRVLDFLDKNEMWDDVLLIVNTDHGFLMGEKDWWAKSVMPCYNELANTPFFISCPDMKGRGTRVSYQAQTPDIPATILDYCNIEAPKEMTGKSLLPLLKGEKTKIHDHVIFGFHGSFVNITDGDYVYMRAAANAYNAPLYEYTLMPTHQQSLFTCEELKYGELSDGFGFTKETKILKIPVLTRLKNATFCNSFQYGSKLWSLRDDPQQENALVNPAIEADLLNALIKQMQFHEAPEEQYERFGIKKDKHYTAEDMVAEHQLRKDLLAELTEPFNFADEAARNSFIGFISLVPKAQRDRFMNFTLERYEAAGRQFSLDTIKELTEYFYSQNEGANYYFMEKLKRTQ